MNQSCRDPRCHCSNDRVYLAILCDCNHIGEAVSEVSQYGYAAGSASVTSTSGSCHDCRSWNIYFDYGFLGCCQYDPACRYELAHGHHIHGVYRFASKMEDESYLGYDPGRIF